MDFDFGRVVMLFLMFIPILAFHEAAHAWVADKLGDMTPRSQGRLTLNPIAHIDPLGTILIPLASMLAGSFALIGWGKPVMVDPSQFRNWRRDDILVSLAGPASNIILATLALFACRWLPYNSGLRELGEIFAFVSVYLAVFNMIPIPPLDGWHPLKHAFRIPEEVVYRFGLMWYVVLLLLINFAPVRVALRGATNGIMALLEKITFF